MPKHIESMFDDCEYAFYASQSCVVPVRTKPAGWHILHEGAFSRKEKPLN